MFLFCVDVSFALKLVLPEPESPLIAGKWEEWQKEGSTIIAPWLFAFEALSVLRNKASRKEMTNNQGWTSWNVISNLGIEIRHHDNLWKRAWELAVLHQMPTIYDTCYLALAELNDCDLWTSDRKFFNALSRQEPRVHVL